MSTPAEQFTAPVMDRVQVLPYFSSWWQWEEHLNECAPCMAVMSTGPGDIESLCPRGQIAGTAARWDIDQQHEAAKSN